MKFKIGDKVLYNHNDKILKATIIGFDTRDDDNYLLGIDDSAFDEGHDAYMVEYIIGVTYDNKYDYYRIDEKCYWARERDLRKDEKKMKFKIGDKVLLFLNREGLKATVIGIDGERGYLLGVDDPYFAAGHHADSIRYKKNVIYDHKYDHYRKEGKCWWAEKNEIRKDEVKMKATLKINGEEIEVEISEEELEKLKPVREVNYAGLERLKDLYEKLTKFAVEHRDRKYDCRDAEQSKYHIYYNYKDGKFEVDLTWRIKYFGQICFDRKETAEKAIEEFRDELEWYYTEFKDSLGE